MFGKNVFWCLDCDEPGKLATNTHITRHFVRPMEKGKFTSVRSVELPLPGTGDSKDISDYLIRSGFTVHDFVKMCLDTPELMVAGMANDETATDAIKVDSFIEALKNRDYIDKRITVPLTIAGCSDRLYHAIRTYKVSKCEFLDEEGGCCMGDDPVSREDEVIPYGSIMAGDIHGRALGQR